MPVRLRRSGFVGVGRLGFVAMGSGEREFDCSGSLCGGTPDPDEYDDKSGLVLGVDLFGHLSPQFRLGGGLLYAPTTKMEDDDGEGKLGSDLSVLAIGEGVFDVGPTTALTARLFLGGVVLFPGDDLEDENDSISNSCSDTSLDCSFSEGANSSFTYGIGAGVAIDVGSLALRLDLLMQWYSAETRSFSMTDPDPDFGGDLAQQEKVSGTRTIISAGLEF